MKKLLVNSGFSIFLAITTCYASYATSEEKQKTFSVLTAYDPNSIENDEIIEENEEWESDIPNTYADLLIEWGLTGLQKAPKRMALKTWQSRILTGKLFYNIPISTSHFMASFGMAFSEADFMLDKIGGKEGSYYALNHSEGNKTKLIKADSILNNGNITRTMLSVKYFDFIFETRFNGNREEPQEGFFIAVGTYIGFQFWPSMTIHYKEDKEVKTWTNQEQFGINKLNYGVTGRIGWNRFGLFYTQALSNLFESNNGISKQPILPWSAGITLSLF
jgi:hypothetical protein